MLSITGLLMMIQLFTPMSLPSIYQFKVASIDGKVIDFSQFAGKKILIVNTASECGFTPQYEGLEKLYEENKDKMVVIGFPSNDFFSQEPGTNDQIAQFCSSKYNVTFPMAAKIEVKGKNMAPIYKWLTQKSMNGVEDSKVSWNFNKYLINEKGEYVKHFGSTVTPDDPKLLEAINYVQK
jgi:glutathione peroxidase